MALIDYKIGYTKKMGDFDFLRADIGISDIDTSIPWEIHEAELNEFLPKIGDYAKEQINIQYKAHKEGIGK
tara:strand:+ start:119 stop:331 length:213 start_codon:yes stop_codon:yes gene_type:complete